RAMRTFPFYILWRPPMSTLFPYTTLFRSDEGVEPDINDVARIARHRDAPAEAGARDRQVAQTALDEADDLVSARARKRGHQLRRSEEHTSELQSLTNIVCRLLLEKKKLTY